MPLLNGKELLARKSSRQLAVPHFDVGGGNLDMAWAICQALAEKESAAFLAGTPASVKSYLGYRQFVETLGAVARKFGVSVALHLDHATGLADIRAALEAGFTSVMFDGSRLSLEDNIQTTRMAVELAREFGASAEGELGTIGGQEDELGGIEIRMPTAAVCIRFVEETGIDILAPAVGTRHGFYAKPPRIDLALAEELGKTLSVPLALHGATGLDPAMVRNLVKAGFRKVNFATGIRSVFRQGILESINQDQDATRPQTYLSTGRARVAEFVRDQLALLC